MSRATLQPAELSVGLRESADLAHEGCDGRRSVQYLWPALRRHPLGRCERDRDEAVHAGTGAPTRRASLRLASVTRCYAKWQSGFDPGQVFYAKGIESCHPNSTSAPVSAR